MTRRRNILLLTAALAAIALTVALWPKPRGYTYQGKTVEEWFDEFMKQRKPRWSPHSPRGLSPAEAAFHEMGTNAVPFLVQSRSSPFEVIPSVSMRMQRERDAARYLRLIATNPPASALNPPLP